MLSSSALLMADPGEATPKKGRASKKAATPRDKSTLRQEKFFEYEWGNLPDSLRRCFLVHVCDTEGWHFDEVEVMKMESDALLSEIQAFVSGHKINFPWASDIATFLELGDNAAVF